MTDESAPVIDLDPERFAALIAAGGRLIDVRRPYEFEGSRLAGADNVEMNELPAAAESIDRERPVLFYCRSGNRSGMAAEAFHQAGYEAYHLAGGLEAWVAAGRPVEPEDGGVRTPLPAS